MKVKEAKKAIENVFEDLDINFSLQEFMQLFDLQLEEQKKIKKVEKKIKKELKKEKEKNKPLYVDVNHVFNNVEDIDVFIKNFVGEIDSYGRYEDIPNEGIEAEVFLKVNGKIFKVDYHIEADWISDYSVRANVSGESTLKGYKEVEEYEVYEESTESEHEWVSIIIKRMYADSHLQ